MNGVGYNLETNKQTNKMFFVIDKQSTHNVPAQTTITHRKVQAGDGSWANSGRLLSTLDHKPQLIFDYIS